MCQALFSKVKDFVLFLPRLLQRLENLGGRDTKKHPQMTFRGSQGAEVMGPSIMNDAGGWDTGPHTELHMAGRPFHAPTPSLSSQAICTLIKPLIKHSWDQIRF